MQTERASSTLKICTNCGSEVPEIYCSTCGKKFQQSRITFRGMLHNWYRERREDIYIYYITTRDLLLHPSKVIKGYWEGKTEHYYHPFNYFLVMTSILIFITLSKDFDAEKVLAANDQIEEIYSNQPNNPAVEKDEKTLEAEKRVQEFQLKLFLMMRKNFNLLLLAAIPFLALGIHWMVKRQKRTYGEQLIYSFYVQGFNLLIGLPLFLFVDPMDNSSNLRFLTVPFAISFMAWTLMDLYKFNVLKAIVLTILAEIIYFTLFVLSFAILGFLGGMAAVGLGLI